MSESVAIIVPTRGNRAFLEPCIASIQANTQVVDYHIYVANNGPQQDCVWAAERGCTVLEHGAGQGWVDGLIAGERASREPYLLLLNDDTLILPSERLWLHRMCSHLEDSRVGAVGPGTNTANSQQSIWFQGIPTLYIAPKLIGFCMLVRRSALDVAGGFDHGMQSADDLDLSYRLRRANYLLLGDRGVFVFHAGFATGSRVHGPHTTPGGYNSWEWAARDSELLLRKHGPGIFEYLSSGGVPVAYTRK